VQSRERVLVGNPCGGVGTYSGFGSLGMEIDRRVMNELGLGTADIAWHTSRDRPAEFACLMAMVFPDSLVCSLAMTSALH